VGGGRFGIVYEVTHRPMLSTVCSAAIMDNSPVYLQFRG